VCATGYRPGLEQLLGDLVELDGFGFPRLSGNHRDGELPGLWFFGIDRDPYGNLSVLRAETRRLRKEFESVAQGQRRDAEAVRVSDPAHSAA
jgi:hypothetical protein